MITLTKRWIFRQLQMLFEGDARLLSAAVLGYILIWFSPLALADLSFIIEREVWDSLGWQPRMWVAAIIIPLAIVQVVCNHQQLYMKWLRTLVALLLSGFVIYTALIPAYSMWLAENTLPSYLTCSIPMSLISIVIVAREYRRA